MDIKRVFREVGETAALRLEEYLTGLGFILWGKGGGPPTPDYEGMARGQAAANVQSAIAERLLSQVSQATPFGSLSFRQVGSTRVPGVDRVVGSKTRVPVTDPKTGEVTYVEGPSRVEQITPAYEIPQFESTIALSPEQQRLLSTQTAQQQALGDIATGLLGRIGQSVETPFTIDPAFGQAAEEAAYARATSRLDPQFEQLERMERTRLANQGFDPTSEAFRNALADFERRRADTYEQARRGAVQEGRAERAQRIQEALLSRQLPLQEFSALRSGVSPSLPQFQGQQMQQIAPPDLLGAAARRHQGELERYGIEQQQEASMLSGLLRLGLGAMTGGLGSAIPISV